MLKKAEYPQYQLQFHKCLWWVYQGIHTSWETHQWKKMDCVTVPVKEYMADYPIRGVQISFLFCQLCIIYYIFALSSQSKLLPTLASNSTICYLCLLVTLWPGDGFLVHRSYQASGQRKGKHISFLNGVISFLWIKVFLSFVTLQSHFFLLQCLPLTMMSQRKDMNSTARGAARLSGIITS